MKILVTGAAGFIGSKLMFMLAERGDEVVGLDNINDYYDVRLKYGRLREGGIEQPGDNFAYGAMVQSSKLPYGTFKAQGPSLHINIILEQQSKLVLVVEFLHYLFL